MAELPALKNAKSDKQLKAANNLREYYLRRISSYAEKIDEEGDSKKIVNTVIYKLETTTNVDDIFKMKDIEEKNPAKPPRKTSRTLSNMNSIAENEIKGFRLTNLSLSPFGSTN